MRAGMEALLREVRLYPDRLRRRKKASASSIFTTKGNLVVLVVENFSLICTGFETSWSNHLHNARISHDFKLVGVSKCQFNDGCAKESKRAKSFNSEQL